MAGGFAPSADPAATSPSRIVTNGGGRPPRHRARWRWPLLGLAVLVLVALVAVVLATRSDDDGGGGATPAARDGDEPDIEPTVRVEDAAVVPVPGAGLVTAEEVERRAAAAERGDEPEATAWEELLEDADDAVARGPNPQEPLDIPDTDGPFVEDGAAAYALALAAVGTGEDRYAGAGRDHLLAWATTNRTTENTCKDSGACQTSLIIGRAAPGYVFAADLLATTGVLDDEDRATIDGWFRDVLLPATSTRANNWGDAGTMADVVITNHLGDTEGLREALGAWRSRMDLVEDDGHIPEETRRDEDGMTYTQGALTYKVAVAEVAERLGIDLWSYEGARGGSLRKAVDHLAAYWDRPGDWPWFDGIDEPPSVGPLWDLVHAQWQDPEHGSIAEQRRPIGDVGKSGVVYTTFTTGLPVG
jgi:hypothetical protein